MILFYLIMGMESVPETSYFLNHLTRLVAREDCIKSCRHEILKSYTTVAAQDQEISTIILKIKFRRKIDSKCRLSKQHGRNWWPPNNKIPHFGGELVLNAIKQTWCTFTSLNKRSTTHRNDREMMHTHITMPVCEQKIQQRYRFRGYARIEKLGNQHRL